MANEAHIEILNQGIKVWNRWRNDNPKVRPDFRDSDLKGRNLSNVNFKDALLSNADLRDTVLVAADLTDVDDLIPKQLAGADLSRAKLPEYISKFPGLVNIEEASKNAKKTLFMLMLACAYVVLTIANTTDAQLITNFASSTLPIIGVKIPLVLFYYTAPFVLLSIFIYYHINLQRLWRELAALPSFFQDGCALDMKVYPWLVNSVVVTYCEKLKDEQKSPANLRWIISCCLGLGITPLTIGLLWWRYLNRHDFTGSIIHICCLVFSICFLVFYKRNLHDTFRKPIGAIYQDKKALVVFLSAFVLGFALYYYSHSAIKGMSPPPFLSTDNLSPVADLQNEDVSIKPPDWRNEIDFVIEARLSKRNLRYAKAYNAFLAKAELSEADLYRANLEEADLRGANLEGALLNEVKLRKAKLQSASLKFAQLSRALLNGALLNSATLQGATLKRAYLDNADLTDANLYGATLQGASMQDACLKDADLKASNLQEAKLIGADLDNAEIENADLRGAKLLQIKNLDISEVKNAKNWDLAYYDKEIIEELGLPPDHNITVKKKLNKVKMNSAGEE